VAKIRKSPLMPRDHSLREKIAAVARPVKPNPAEIYASSDPTDITPPIAPANQNPQPK
jgi:hypothetical protein